MAGPVVPMLAPYVDVLATIMGTPLDLLHFVVGGHRDFLASYTTPNHGNGYHWTLTSVRSVLLRRSLHWSWRQRRSPALFYWSTGRSLILLPCNTAWGRSPRGLITPCRGTRFGSDLGRVLIDHLRRRDRNGLCHGLLWGSLPYDDLLGGHRLGCPRADNTTRINIRGSTTKKAQSKITTPKSNFTKKKLFLIQIGTLVRRSEDPSPNSPSRCHRLRPSWSCLLDVRGRWILGNPTTVAWCDVGVAAGSMDQGWGHLLLLLVVDNSNKPTTLGRSADRSRPLAHQRAYSRYCRCCSC
jgi:hypothetical protein